MMLLPSLAKIFVTKVRTLNIIEQHHEIAKNTNSKMSAMGSGPFALPTVRLPNLSVLE
jgi:hypothetical protein